MIVMKKVLTTWMTLCLEVVALACGSNDPEVDGMTNAVGQSDVNESVTGKRSIVIFFSRAGENWEVGNVERGNTTPPASITRVPAMFTASSIVS